MNLAQLKEPFPADRVSWRVGSTNGEKTRGMALAYIDARDVQDRLDTVCGPDNWQCRYALLGATTVCEVGIKVGADWVWKADGAGATDFEGEKGALSDAFKRAAVKWGIGRYLYDVDAPWVAIEGSGKSFKIKSEEMAKLRGALGKSAPPAAPAPTPAPKATNGAAPPPPATAPKAKTMTPEEWAASARATIRDFDSSAGLNAWVNKNDSAIHKLERTNPKEFDAVQEEMQCAYSRLSTLMAG